MVPAHALASLRYAVSAEPLVLEAEDGVRLAGHRLGEGPTALVFCHGFFGWHRKPRLVRFQEMLARRFTVYAFDFRGHAQSGGLCAFGAVEHLDVDSAVRRARTDGFDRVVTFGASMGGIAVIRHGALRGEIDAVVAVSTPATWDGHESEAINRVMWFTGTRTGRRILRSVGLRVMPTWTWVESPAELVARISPTPLLLVHGRDDHFFDEEQAWTLYREAREPKRLFLCSRFGHAEDGFTERFADYIGDAIERALVPTDRPRSNSALGVWPATVGVG